MNNQTPILGAFLRAAREQKSLSLRDAEKVVGISNAYLSQLEGGKIRQPSPTVLHKLAKFYGVPYAKIMHMAGYPTLTADDKPSGLDVVAARLGRVTDDEAERLADYLAFLRSKRGRSGAR